MGFNHQQAEFKVLVGLIYTGVEDMYKNLLIRLTFSDFFIFI